MTNTRKTIKYDTCIGMGNHGRSKPRAIIYRVVKEIAHLKRFGRLSYTTALYTYGTGPRSLRRDIEGLRLAGFRIRAENSAFFLEKSPL